MFVHGPDQSHFVRPQEPPPTPQVSPNPILQPSAVTASVQAEAYSNDFSFQDPNRDGRRSLYQETGGKYAGFFLIGDVALHRPITLTIDFGRSASEVDFIVALEGPLAEERGQAIAMHAHGRAALDGRLTVIFPPLLKHFKEPLPFTGFHVYAWPVGRKSANVDLAGVEAKATIEAAPAQDPFRGKKVDYWG